MENAFGKLESMVANILAFVDLNPISSLTLKQRYCLAEFMAVQLYRTPKIKEMLSQAATEIETVEFQLKTLKECKAEIVDKFGEAAYTQSLDRLNGGQLVTKLIKDWYVRTVFLGRTPRIRNLINSMSWRKVKVKKGLEKGFVCSDHPFAVRRRGILVEDRLDRIVGLNEPEAEFYFPVSNKLMLIGSHVPKADETANRFRVDILNQVIFANRHNFVWASSPCMATKLAFEQLGEFRIPAPSTSRPQSDESIRSYSQLERPDTMARKRERRKRRKAAKKKRK